MTDFRNSIGFQVPGKAMAYQANAAQIPMQKLQDTSPMRGSARELKVRRNRLGEMHGLDGLPGFTEPLNTQNEDNEVDENLSQTIRDERNKANTIAMITPLQKLKYLLMLILLIICRSSLYPLMAAIPQPIVHKLVWRSLLVDSCLL